MVTIVTHVPLKEGAERKWDTVMRKRMAAAERQPGWVGGQLLQSPNGRMIVGTWRSQADWEVWHQTLAFTATRRQLIGLVDEPIEPTWHEVVLDVRTGKAVPAKRTADS